MSRKNVVLIAGSPSVNSRSSRLLDALGKRLATEGVDVHSFEIASFDPAALLHARFDQPTLAGFVAQIAAADALIVSSPVYKAIYTGALKTIVDLIPYDALVNKTALGIATAKSRDHLLSVGAAYAQLFGFFRVKTAVPAITFLDEEVFADAEATRFSTTVESALDERARLLLAAIR